MIIKVRLRLNCPDTSGVAKHHASPLRKKESSMDRLLELVAQMNERELAELNAWIECTLHIHESSGSDLPCSEKSSQ